MTVTSYAYAKLCDSARLAHEISLSAIVTAIDHIETTSSPANTTVYMKDALSGGDETILDGLVDAHVNEPLPENQAQLITTGTKESLGREVFSMSAFAVNTDYEVKATGFKSTVTAEQTVNIDHAVGAEDRYINGVALYCENAVMGDVADLFVVDKDRVYAGILYPNVGSGEVVLRQFGFDVNIFPDTLHQFIFNYLARLPAGVYVRLRYESTGIADVKVGCNLFLHKKTS